MPSVFLFAAADMPLSRRVAPTYADGTYEPITAGRPNPHDVATKCMLGDKGLKSYRNRTALLTFFGKALSICLCMCCCRKQGRQGDGSELQCRSNVFGKKQNSGMLYILQYMFTVGTSFDPSWLIQLSCGLRCKPAVFSMFSTDKSALTLWEVHIRSGS